MTPSSSAYLSVRDLTGQWARRKQAGPESVCLSHPMILCAYRDPFAVYMLPLAHCFVPSIDPFLIRQGHPSFHRPRPGSTCWTNMPQLTLDTRDLSMWQVSRNEPLDQRLVTMAEPSTIFKSINFGIRHSDELRSIGQLQTWVL